MRRTIALLATTLVLPMACGGSTQGPSGPEPGQLGGECLPDDTCADGLVCILRTYCLRPESPDVAGNDSAPDTAGIADTAEPDTGEPDTGEPDTGLPDFETSDTDGDGTSDPGGDASPLPCTGDPLAGTFLDKVWLVRQGGTFEARLETTCADVDVTLEIPGTDMTPLPAESTAFAGGVLTARFSIPADFRLPAGEYQVIARTRPGDGGGTARQLPSRMRVHLDMTKTGQANTRWVLLDNAYAAPLEGGSAVLIDPDLLTKGSMVLLGPGDQVGYVLQGDGVRSDIRMADLSKSPPTVVTAASAQEYVAAQMFFTPDGTRFVWGANKADWGGAGNYTTDLWWARWPAGTGEQISTGTTYRLMSAYNDHVNVVGNSFARVTRDGKVLYGDPLDEDPCGTGSSSGNYVGGLVLRAPGDGSTQKVADGPIGTIQLDDDARFAYMLVRQCPSGSRSEVQDLVSGGTPSWWNAVGAQQYPPRLFFFGGIAISRKDDPGERYAMHLPDGAPVHLPEDFPDSSEAWGTHAYASASTDYPMNSVGLFSPGGAATVLPAAAFGGSQAFPMSVSGDDSWVAVRVDYSREQPGSGFAKVLNLKDAGASPLPAAGVPLGSTSLTLMRPGLLVTAGAYARAPAFEPVALPAGSVAFHATCEDAPSILYVDASGVVIHSLDPATGKDRVVQRTFYSASLTRPVEIPGSRVAALQDSGSGGFVLIEQRSPSASTGYRPCPSHGGITSAQ